MAKKTLKKATAKPAPKPKVKQKFIPVPEKLAQQCGQVLPMIQSLESQLALARQTYHGIINAYLIGKADATSWGMSKDFKMLKVTEK